MTQKKIAICGGSQTGKATFTQVLRDGKYVPENVSKPEAYWEYSMKVLQIKGEDFKLHLGHAEYEEYPCSRNFAHQDGIFALFAVNCRESFLHLEPVIKNVRKWNSYEIATVIVANKTDLAESERVVSKSEAEKWANENGFYYTEISSFQEKDVLNAVDILFDCMAKLKQEQKEHIRRRQEQIERDNRIKKNCSLL